MEIGDDAEQLGGLPKAAGYQYHFDAAAVYGLTLAEHGDDGGFAGGGAALL